MCKVTHPSHAPPPSYTRNRRHGLLPSCVTSPFFTNIFQFSCLFKHSYSPSSPTPPSGLIPFSLFLRLTFILYADCLLPSLFSLFLFPPLYYLSNFRNFQSLRSLTFPFPLGNMAFLILTNKDNMGQNTQLLCFPNRPTLSCLPTFTSFSPSQIDFSPTVHIQVQLILQVLVSGTVVGKLFPVRNQIANILDFAAESISRA